MTTCSVIIINYNTGELLKQAIDAVQCNQQVSEIIVVDNDSQDGSMDLINESDKVKKVFRQENYGFASSCNFAAKITTSDTLLFLNPDCIVKDNTVDLLLDYFDKEEKAGIIGVRVNNPDGSEQRATRRRLPTLLRAIKTFSGIENLAKHCSCFAGVNLNHLPMPKTIQDVEAVSGAFIMIKASVFNEFNGFDDKFPMHFEDLDLFKRTLDLGYKVLFAPNIEVVHYQGTSSKSNPEVAKLKRQGLKRYFKKHCSILSSKLINLLL
ncbi:MAG: glycosyltransferase family 2 protein [Proteobacteria bacterium]|nr:glycosyltransferase family 2 protein [Pseudomonadota bacterium]